MWRKSRRNNRFGVIGTVNQETSEGRGMVRLGSRGKSRTGSARCVEACIGMARHGSQGEFSHGKVGSGQARRGSLGLARPVGTVQGVTGFGSRGTAWLGRARGGKAVEAGFVAARCGCVRNGYARKGTAGQGLAVRVGHGSWRTGLSRHGMTSVRQRQNRWQRFSGGFDSLRHPNPRRKEEMKWHTDGAITQTHTKYPLMSQEE